MYKPNKIRGFAALPLIIGGAIIVAGLISGAVYELKTHDSNLSVNNKNSLMADVSGVTSPITCTDSDGGKNYYVKGYANGDFSFWSALGRTDFYTVNENCTDPLHTSGCKKTNGEKFDTYNDFCQDSSSLAEAFCDQGQGKMFSSTYVCPKGCKNGACLPAIASFTATDPASDPNQTSAINLSASANANISITAICPSGISLGTVDLDGKMTPAVSSGGNCFQLTQSNASGATFYVRAIGNTATAIVNFIATFRDASGNTLDTRTLPVIFGPSTTTCTDSDGKDFYIKGITRGLYPLIGGTGEAIQTRIDSCFSNYQGKINKVVAEWICKDNELFDDAYECPNGCVDGACVANSTIASQASVPAVQSTTQTQQTHAVQPVSSSAVIAPSASQTTVVSPSVTAVPSSNTSFLQQQINALIEMVNKLKTQLGIVNSDQQSVSPVATSQTSATSVAAPTNVSSGTILSSEEEPTIAVEQTELFSYIWNKDLYYGLTNDKDVEALQNVLVMESCYAGPVTGNFYRLTRAGVICFQKKYNFINIPGTGYVGTYTRKVLNELYSK